MLPVAALHVDVSYAGCPPGVTVDVSAFLLNEHGKVASDQDFIFFNQLTRHDQGVELDLQKSRFTLQLDKTTQKLQKIALVLTISQVAKKNQHFGLLGSITVLVKDFLTGLELACFSLNTHGFNEAALIMAEIYRHQQQWKFRALGQGFIGGLQPLAEYYGVDVGEGEAATDEAAKITPVNLSKITLEKKGQSISLEKQGDGLGEVIVNLNWNSTPIKVLGNTKTGASIDLDLACLWEFNDGSIGAVQALGGHFGALHHFPFIELDQDDRSGQSLMGETLRINGQHWPMLKRVLIFTFIYDGVPNWSHVDAVITIKAKMQPDIEVRLDSHRNDQFMCAIAMLENINQQLRITKLVDYFSGHQAMDKAYGWGLNYVSGTKS
ncbi:stress response protein [Methylocucumis oryzae]|uniref:Stress response protein n=1 Tax=Methylocucumis oryzae TaxID=1632867 RepID=A0A0F3IG89_9GAMM|nr:stress response protein [Methylocucumis oryzae]